MADQPSAPKTERPPRLDRPDPPHRPVRRSDTTEPQVAESSITTSKDDSSLSTEAEDGRRARRDRNRMLVLDAVLDLFTQGDLHPHPDDVATRSGISVRSIYRYFPTPEAMWRAAMDQHFERVRPLFDPPDTEGLNLEDRIVVLLTSRLRLYTEISAVARAARLSAMQSKAVNDRLRQSREYLRNHIELVFKRELDALPTTTRELAVDAIDSAIQVDALDYLKMQRQLADAQIIEILSHTIHCVLMGSTLEE